MQKRKSCTKQILVCIYTCTQKVSSNPSRNVCVFMTTIYIYVCVCVCTNGHIYIIPTHLKTQIKLYNTYSLKFYFPIYQYI